MHSRSLIPLADPLPANAGIPVAGAANEVGQPLTPVFYQQHLWMPLVPFVLLFVLLVVGHGDLWIADRVYAMEGHAWTLQSGFITQDLLHAAARQASKAAWFVMLLALCLCLCVRRLQAWRRPLSYLLLSTLLATAIVGLMKRWTHVDCPWDLTRYGGSHVYYSLVMHRPGLAAAGKCFPAGHASAGYAWVALYFALLGRPSLRWWGLGVGLGLGLVFGVTQQLRGAHFASHDLVALGICWLVALALHRLMRLPQPASAAAGESA